ncbi:MAG: ATP-binding protein [Alphaproteobacteria bacterium]|nr:ATP-binding protein [Alphaproteobacteria bacterium]MDP6814002.1 ATP-binding protein [Alphaproteobacteria bacterium]
MKQVLLNLLSNAVKFTPAGGEIGIEADFVDGGGVMLAVRDSGIGMREKDIPLALEPFSQLDTPLIRRSDGVGLGLAIARRLTEQHDGRLEMTSQPGAGTTARILLPPSRVIADQHPGPATAGADSR